MATTKALNKMYTAGNTNRTGMLNTVDLLIKAAHFETKVNNILSIQNS
jgi:hypothetical protein